MEEEKNKIDKAIEQAIRQVGQERDAEDIATLQRFMAKKNDENIYKVCYYAPQNDNKFPLKPRTPISKEERAKIVEEQQRRIEEQLEQKQRLKTRKRYRYLYFLSSIAAIIAIVFSLNIYQDNCRMDKAFEAYYTPLEYDSQLMSRGDDTLSPELVSAMESYQAKDYVVALHKFNAMPQVDENYQIYKAICLLETDKTKDTISLLEKLVGNGEGTEYYQQACWYLALAYLRNHDECNFFEIVKNSSDINFENIKYLMNHD